MTNEALVAEVDPDAPRDTSSRAPSWAGPAAGLIAGAVALGTGALVAAWLDVPSPLESVGGEFIDRTPSWLKDPAIRWFDTADKQALRVGMLLTAALFAAVLGALSRRNRRLFAPMMVLFGVFGAVVAAGRPAESFRAAVPALVAGVVGAAVLWHLSGRVAAGDGPRESPSLNRPTSGWDRRAFMLVGGGATAGAIVATVAARGIEDQRIDDLIAAAPTELPDVAEPVVPIAATGAPIAPQGSELFSDTPYFTPNGDFYLIDTALSVPGVNLDRWRLSIGGRVDSPLEFSYADLLALPHVERVITLCCVSNEVGGDLVGNAVWQGVLLAPLLERAGVQPEAEQVFARSVDGWTCGFPVSAALDGRDAMIALGMNGEPLPRQHGFPARVVVPGLYGYVSATKWVERLDLATWDEATGYWIPRGWSRDAPVKTQSRIDVPRRGDRPSAGPVAIAGVAWAQHRGVQRVEVRIDDGEWAEAELARDVTVDSWRQWRLVWDAAPGEHRVQVRATDGDGVTQTEQVSRPDPDGATGWHTRRITIT